MVLYWLCSLPIGEAGDAADRAAWARLRGVAGDAAEAHRFRLPEALRVGTLDALLALSDDLAKANAAAEGAVNKVRRQLYELALAGEGPAPALRVEGLAPEAFLQRFAWDEPKYPSRRPPADTLRAVGETVARLDEGLKTRGAEYAAVRAALAAAARRAGGSLAVRDLSAAVPPAALVATENLTTLVVVVPKAARADWFAAYEHLTGYVVPRSSAVVAEDGDHFAATVVLFRRVAEEFRAAARARGFQAKELPAAAAAAAAAGEEAGGEAAGGGSEAAPGAAAPREEEVVDVGECDVAGGAAARRKLRVDVPPRALGRAGLAADVAHEARVDAEEGGEPRRRRVALVRDQALPAPDRGLDERAAAQRRRERHAQLRCARRAQHERGARVRRRVGAREERRRLERRGDERHGGRRALGEEAPAARADDHPGAVVGEARRREGGGLERHAAARLDRVDEQLREREARVRARHRASEKRSAARSRRLGLL